MKHLLLMRQAIAAKDSGDFLKASRLYREAARSVANLKSMDSQTKADSVRTFMSLCEEALAKSL